MKMTLFRGVLLGVFALGALVGLFVFATYSSTGGGSADIGTVIIWGTLPSASVTATLAASTQIDPSLKNVSYVQKEPATLASDLASAIATENAPDLVLASQEELSALSRFLTPIPMDVLPPSTFAGSFVAGARVFTYPDGSGYYGVPFLVDPLVLYSNRALLSSSGVAKPPSTWEALIGLVPKVAVLTPTRQISRGLVALGTYDNVRNARGILSSLFLQQNVPISGYTASGQLVSDMGLSGGNGLPPGPAVLSFYTQFADPSKVSYTWNVSLPDSQRAFLSGDLALYFGYASEARYLRAANPNLDFTVSTLPQPATASVKGAYGLLYAFMFPRGAHNSSGGFQAAALLSNAAEQAAAAGATGLAPANLSELSNVPSDPAAAIAYAEALYTRGWLSPTPPATDSIFSSMIKDVISGRSNSQTAIVAAERSLNSLLTR